MIGKEIGTIRVNGGGKKTSRSVIDLAMLLHFQAFEMATGEHLFDPQPGKYFSRDDGKTPSVLFISQMEVSQSLCLDVFSPRSV